MFKLRKVALLLGGVVACGVFGTGSASAVSPIYNWTGFYVGVNGSMSGGQFSQEWSDTGVPYNTDHAFASGFSGGGQAGVNFQPAMSPLLVARA